MSLLLLGLLIGLLALLVHGRHGGPRRATLLALALAYGAPALFLTLSVLGARHEATRLRFALLGLGFRGSADAPLRVSVGGDRDAHDVWISALADERGTRPTHLGDLVFPPPELTADGERLPDGAFVPAAGAVPGLLGLRPPGEALHPLPALRLAHGDRLTVGGRVWEVDLETGITGPPARFVDAEGQMVSLPRRRGELPLIQVAVPIFRAFSVSSETYPLAWLEKAISGDLPSPRPQGFFFWQREGLFGSSLWLSTADAAAVTVERGGEPLAPAERFTLPPGQGVHVLSPPHWDENGFRAGGVRDRRSFRLQRGRRSVALLYDRPELYVLPREALEALAIQPLTTPTSGPGEAATRGDAQEEAETLRLNLSMGGWQVTDRSLYFRHASRAVALEALATLSLPRRALKAPGQGGSFAAATPRGQRRAQLGTPVWLGGDKLAAVQLDVLAPPLGLALFALLLAALKTVAAHAARLRVGQLLFAAPLEALVALRALLGFRVWALPPFKAEAMELAMVAWVFLPWAFLLLAVPVGEGRRPWRTALPALGGWFFSLAWCSAFGGGGLRAGVWVFCHLLLLGLFAARATGALERLTNAIGARLARLEDERRILWLWVGALLLPGVLRVLLLMLGFRESLQLGGQRFALSLLHVPVALLLEAAYLLWLWRRIAGRGRLLARDLLPALAVVLGTWLVPALFVSDLGLALLNVPVFLLALTLLTLASGRRLSEEAHLGRGWGLHLAPAVVLGLYLAVAAFPLGARALLGLIPAETETALESERNYLRLLAHANRQRLAGVARRDSEELSVMSTVMRAYTAGPFGGRGYFHSELSPHIEATALREHAPAVFVAAEWGLAGTIGVVLLFLVAARSGRGGDWRDETRWLDPGTGSEGFWAAAAALAALTFALPSIYMVLANYQLTLFTGKNAYLLGLDSTADVLEVLALTALVALGTAVAREEEEEA